jgi:hypothetical protein
MADEQDIPDERPEATPPAPPAKKAPAKKVPAKKAPAKKAPAKKVPAKKAAAKKIPAKKAPTADVAPPSPGPALADTNGSTSASAGAKEAAAQAKSTVDRADDSLSQPALVAVPEHGRSRLPLAVAIAVSLLAILLVRQLRRGDDE